MKYRWSARETFDDNLVRHIVLHRAAGKEAYSYADIPASATRSQIAGTIWSLRRHVREFVRMESETQH